jgi:PTH1 family peptidyl-tRNA hydrolase
MRDARARRKIVVIGTNSDYHGAAAPSYVYVARQALALADHVFFVGPWASRCLRAKRHPGDESLRAFATARAASDHLSRFLRRGDLVLLKGSTVADHLARIVLARTARVECWRTHCHRRTICDWCALLTVPVEPDAASRDDVPPDVGAPGEAGEALVVVGLGSSVRGTRDAPSSVGLDVVDRLARQLGQAWEPDADALVTRAVWNGQTVCLVKPVGTLGAGPALARVIRRLGVTVSQCLVVYDDVDLPLGTVRVRKRGSAGRHEGMRSVIQTFQSEAIPRVKVGVGRPPGGSPAERDGAASLPGANASLEQACARATDALLELVGSTRATAHLPPS